MSQQLTKHHPQLPNGHADISTNNSGNPGFEAVLNARLTRRSLFKGGAGLAVTGFMGVGLSACGAGADSVNVAVPSEGSAFNLNFTAVAKSLSDVLTVPTGYTATTLYRLGDPINLATSTYANDGSDTADSFNFRAGDHHDGMHYFGLNAAGTAKDVTSSSRGLLVMNHENITQPFLHSAAENLAGFSSVSRVAAQIDKEVNVHGVSVIEVIKASDGFPVNKLSGFNRRITAATLMDLKGPAAGDALLKTKFSTDGTKTRGTVNNCGNGYTPWGTYLTCEENWAGYFKRGTDTQARSSNEGVPITRYGVTSTQGSLGWANPVAGDTSGSDLYNRWNIAKTNTDPALDFAHAANTMGWVVEIDPYSPTSIPCKRTAMGRRAHEGAMPAKVVAGKPIVYYMGDDSRHEYIYKYVSTQNWSAADANTGLTAGSKYLDDGKLYVAQFAADGTGTWLHLSTTSASGSTNYTFANQADVLINSRLAADWVGATPMDRPEWTGVHPVTGDIYVTLTNNSDRGKTGNSTGGKSRGLDAANPRYYSDLKGSATQLGNVNGHIIRMSENNADPAATSFRWDVYLFGAQSDADATHINISGLTSDNDFSSPDGLWFSQAVPGLMWIQTDDGAYTDVTNCMMLAALPGSRGDGSSTSVTSNAVPSNSGANQTVISPVGKKATAATLKRFLVGPKDCEITGITETPDGKAIFINIQHPGENTTSANVGNNLTSSFTSHWPDGGNTRPRSSAVVITKNDGGLVGS